jgi:hypothetical protein
MVDMWEADDGLTTLPFVTSSSVLIDERLDVLCVSFPLEVDDCYAFAVVRVA